MHKIYNAELSGKYIPNALLTLIILANEVKQKPLKISNSENTFMSCNFTNIW